MLQAQISSSNSEFSTVCMINRSGEYACMIHRSRFSYGIIMARELGSKKAKFIVAFKLHSDTVHIS